MTILIYAFLLWLLITVLFVLYFISISKKRKKYDGIEYNDTRQAFKDAEKHFWSDIKNKDEDNYVEY